MASFSGRLAVLLAILLVPVLLLFLNVLVTLHDTSYLLSEAAAPDETARSIILFVQGSSALPEGLSPQEVVHMQDVRSLVAGISALFLALLVLFAALLVWLAAKKEKFLRQLGIIAFSGSALAGVLVLALFLGFRNFPAAFASFHRLFFAPGSYLFFPTETLVTLFPQEFFLALSQHILLSTLSQALVAFFCFFSADFAQISQKMKRFIND